jgi:hypothetical protein
MQSSVMVGSVALAGAALIALSAVATADTASYLNEVGPNQTSLTREQLLHAGSMACAILDAGQPAPVAVDTLYKKMGLGLADAVQIVTAAVRDLDC